MRIVGANVDWDFGIAMGLVVCVSLDVDLRIDILEFKKNNWITIHITSWEVWEKWVAFGASAHRDLFLIAEEPQGTSSDLLFRDSND